MSIRPETAFSLGSFFSEFVDLEAGRPVQIAVIEAGQNRMRPIVLTTLAAILRLLPLALAIGRGSSMQQPLAVATISGLVVQLPLVLLVMPSIFLRLHRTASDGGPAGPPNALAG